jgi:DNA-binding transcriptional ArsR family regulator
MNTVKENLLLHPVRLRIILAAAGRQVTAQQLADDLPDIPQATLYRNINILADAGILSVVQERRVRNTFEKTYAIPGGNLSLSVEDLKNAQPEDYIRLFTQYLGQLLGYYVRYIQQGSVDFPRDNVTFQMIPLYLNAAEIQALGETLNAALLPYLKNEPAPDRGRSILGLISVPDSPRAPMSAAAPAGEPAAVSGDLPKESAEKSTGTNHGQHD